MIVRRRRALGLLGGSLSYGTRRRAAMAHTRRTSRTKNQTPHPRRVRRWGVETSRLEGATYRSCLSVRLPAALWTARESRAVTDIFVLDGLAASTDARQLVDCWARPGCRPFWSEIETKDVII
jgi:hypothetical protein